MVDFFEVNTIKTFQTVFLNPSTGNPLDVQNPSIDIGFYTNQNFQILFTSSLNKKAGNLGTYYKEVFLDPNLYAPSQFFYVRFKGTNPSNSQLIIQEDSFRLLESSKEKKTQALILQGSNISFAEPEFYISANSEINSSRTFLRSQFLGPCDLWVEILDINTNAPTNVYKITYDIEDVTDCSGICNSECGVSTLLENGIPVHFGTGLYYAEWNVSGDANPGPYLIHWDIQYTPNSQKTRISQNFHIVAKKNMYDLNFQNPFSPTAAN